jgi:hypothetical protein
MMKNPFEKKLALYSAMAAGIVGVSAQADAQVVYHDVVPDSSLNLNESMNIDLNNDGTVDFIAQHQDLIFVSSSSTYSYMVSRMMPQGSNMMVISTTSNYAATLNANDLINDSRAFGSWNILASVSSGGYDWGNWNGATDKYLGVQFYIGANVHYGWIRLTVPAGSASMLVQDWAYQSIADSGILAGDQGTMVGIETLSDDMVSVQVRNRQIMLRLHRDLTHPMAEVFDLSGRRLLAEEVTANNCNFDMSAFNPGIYVFTFRSEEGVMTKKIQIF